MKIVLPILLLLSMKFASAQVGGEHVFNFLNITTSAHQAALGGEALTINDDVNQPLWNPASITKFMDNQVAVNYVNFLTDVNMGSITFAHLINRRFGTIHGGIRPILLSINSFR